MEKTSHSKPISVLLFPFCLLNSAAAAQIFVDIDAIGTNTGATWVNAFTDLQDAIELAESSGEDILVAEGLYTPTTGVWPDSATAPEEKTFRLLEDSRLHGGFLGGAGGSTMVNQPDGRFASTVLDGDQGGGINSYHVIVADGEFLTTGLVVDGFRIRNGRANGPSSILGPLHDTGAGILVDNEADIALEHLTIEQNYAQAEGGGIWVDSDDNGDFVCKLSVIRSNIATRGAGLFAPSTMITLDLVNVHFHDNGSDAGGVGGFPPITEEGGGIFFGGEVNLRATNCLIHGNIAEKGGGIFYDPNPAVLGQLFESFLKNCTITANGATNTGNAAGGLHVAPGSPDVTDLGEPSPVLYLDNTILWGNVRGVTSTPVPADLTVLSGNIFEPGIYVPVQYSDLGATVDTTVPAPQPNGIDLVAGNISLDPLFVNAPGSLFQLVNHQSSPSPCIDAGESDLLDIDWRDVDEDGDDDEEMPWDFARTTRRIDNPNIPGPDDLDMGAYEAPPPGP